jgi:hypothetical protein
MTPSPDVVDNDDERSIRGRSADRRRQGKGRRLCWTKDEHGQGPKTAVAEAVAIPLGVQPSIHNAGFSSSTGQSLGLMQL